MNILSHLTLRSLKLNRKRTIVTIIGIILAAAMITGVSTIAASFQDLFVVRAIQTDGNFHASFYDVDTDNIKYIAENPYTKESMLSQDVGFAKFDEAKNEFKPYFFVKEYDDVALQHMPIHLTEGRLPESAGEVVMSEEIQAIGGDRYDIGQSITLEIGNRIDNDTILRGEWYSETEILQPITTKTYTITGFISRPHFERGSATGHTMVTYLDASTLRATDTVNVSILAQNPKEIYEKVPQMAQNAEVENYAYNNELLKFTGISQNANATDFIQSVTLIIILLISVGSITVIYNAFAISVSERKKQFGMLASVGATPKQIRRSVFFEGLILGLIGIPAGIVSGLLGIGVTLPVINRLMIESMFREEVALRLVVSPSIILITVFFVSVIILLSAYLPAKIATKIAPIDAMRLNAEINTKGKKLKTSRLTRYMFGFEGELALKNLKRNRKRYRTTVFSLVISIVLFITISSFMEYSFTSTNMYYRDMPYNMTVSHFTETFEEQQAFYNQVAAMEEVERYSVIRTTRAVANDLDRFQFGTYVQENFIDKGMPFPQRVEDAYRIEFSIVALGENEFTAYLEEAGLDPKEYTDTENLPGILLNKSIIHDDMRTELAPLNVNEGDTLAMTDVISFHDPNGDWDVIDFEVQIGAITESLPFGVSYEDVQNGITLIVSDDVFDVIHQLVFEGYPAHGQLFIKTDQNANLVAGIEALNPQMDNHSLAISDITSEQEEINQTKTAVAILLYGFLTLITLIGVTNIFNTINTNVALRRREFAMLKSVGLTPKGFNKMVNYESIFYGLRALLYGLPVSILISVWIYNSFGNMFQFAFILPWKEIAYCITGVFIIVFMTMMHASSKLKTENIVDALKAENL